MGVQGAKPPAGVRGVLALSLFPKRLDDDAIKRGRQTKGKIMLELSSDLRSSIRPIAERMIQQYVQDILTIEQLTEQIAQEWEVRYRYEDGPAPSELIRIGQRLCSLALYGAWRSTDRRQRDCAFVNIKRYLEESLQYVLYDRLLRQSTDAYDEVLQQTLLELYINLVCHPSPGPTDPVAFLGWVRGVLTHQAQAFLRGEHKRDICDTIDVHFGEECNDNGNHDPENHVLEEELQQAVRDAIGLLPKERYQQVILYIHLGGMKPSEVAHHLQVREQDIYVWHSRALKALRNNPEVKKALQPWLADEPRE